jgi:plasmid stabilization system protein ParE
MKVIWSPEAEATFDQNISYLKENWSYAVIESFFHKTENAISLISKQPLMFPVVNKKKRIHKCVVVKQVSLYYRVTKTHISLLTFWNSYQNPEMLKLK